MSVFADGQQAAAAGTECVGKTDAELRKTSKHKNAARAVLLGRLDAGAGGFVAFYEVKQWGNPSAPQSDTGGLGGRSGRANPAAETAYAASGPASPVPHGNPPLSPSERSSARALEHEDATTRSRNASPLGCCLAADAGDVVRIGDAVQPIGVTREGAAKSFSGWAEQGWLRRIDTGTYVPVQLEVLDSEQADQDP